MPDRHLVSASPGQAPVYETVEQLIEAERGMGAQGIIRSWQASDSNRVVLTSDSSGVKISRDNGVTAPAQVIVDGTQAGGSLAGTYPNPTLAPLAVDALIPPGTIWPYAGGAAPTGWLLCNGTPVSRTTYAKLFAVVSTTYNTGGEAGTDFRLPNLQGKVVLGVSGTHALGTTGGNESVAGPPHTHTGSHSHGLNNHTHPAGEHYHSMQNHTHTSAQHQHALLNTHTHGMTNHDHTLNGHTHGAAALGVGGSIGTASGTATTGVVAGQNVADDNHTHGHSLDVTGTTDGASGSTSGATNYSDGSGLTGNANTGNTSLTTPTDTGGTGSLLTAGISANYDSGGPSTPNTATDASAPAASYGGTTVPTLPPFLSLSYIIRTGA